MVDLLYDLWAGPVEMIPAGSSGLHKRYQEAMENNFRINYILADKKEKIKHLFNLLANIKLTVIVLLL